MEGAQGTLYEGEQFQLQFKFSSKYPFDSPEVSIIMPLWSSVSLLAYAYNINHFT
jgi:ubiquitin-conjugating enzyme E2 W